MPTPELIHPRLEAARIRAAEALLAARAPGGYWVGELSSSALSTATAVTALAVVGREAQNSKFEAQCMRGLAWLAAHASADGGWGDTDRSLSNLSTTALGWAAFGAVPLADDLHRTVVRRAEEWLRRRAGGVAPDQLAPAIIARYGKDRTFSVPILTMCALAGRLGTGREAWRHVIPLPFELAVFPHSWFAALRLPVVSYALPALIAIGQARHHFAPSGNLLARLARNLTRSPSLGVLTKIQPENGGFLEATPLTSFVIMSLAASGQVGHAVTQRGAEFLEKSQRPDGSWPIDTNLATWVTTLSVNALGSHSTALDSHRSSICAWLCAQQYRAEHPYTHAAPGGWAWTDLPGGVPDADDTAGATLALKQLGVVDDTTRAAAFAGVQWLHDLQNRDGGMPTFCRGWGALPFDRSSADITAHAIGAWLAWLDEMPPDLHERTERALNAAIGFLDRTCRPDGSWVPLWFGNQHAPEDENPVYGTSRVLCGLAGAASHPATRNVRLTSICGEAAGWLARSQNSDGGWGGSPGVASTVEESALAVEALAAAREFITPDASTALTRGLFWLIERVESGAWAEPSPIGFYFAKLWYYEKLYPLIFTVGALNRASAALAKE